MIVTFFIFIMVLVLLWQTFPLRYGLLGVLIREFKWTFIVVIAFLGIPTNTQPSLPWNVASACRRQSIWEQLIATRAFGAMGSTCSSTICAT